jgi:hypothetical protein
MNVRGHLVLRLPFLGISTRIWRLLATKAGAQIGGENHGGGHANEEDLVK